MVRLWNIVHYFVYRGFYRFHVVTEKINPLRLIFRMPSVKRFYARKGVDVLSEVDKAWQNPEAGLSNMFAGIVMHVLIGMICSGIIFFYIGIFKIDFTVRLIPAVVVFLIPLVVNHLVLFKQDKYLNYFKELDEMKPARRRRWMWTSLGVVAGITIFAIGSFSYMVYRL